MQKHWLLASDIVVYSTRATVRARDENVLPEPSMKPSAPNRAKNPKGAYPYLCLELSPETYAMF